MSGTRRQWLIYTTTSGAEGKAFSGDFAKLPLNVRRKLAKAMQQAEDREWLIGGGSDNVTKLAGGKNLYELRPRISGAGAPRLIFEARGDFNIAYVAFTKGKEGDNQVAIRRAVAMQKRVRVEGLDRTTVPTLVQFDLGVPRIIVADGLLEMRTEDRPAVVAEAETPSHSVPRRPRRSERRAAAAEEGAPVRPSKKAPVQPATPSTPAELETRERRKLTSHTLKLIDRWVAVRNELPAIIERAEQKRRDIEEHSEVRDKYEGMARDEITSLLDRDAQSMASRSIRSYYYRMQIKIIGITLSTVPLSMIFATVGVPAAIPLGAFIVSQIVVRMREYPRLMRFSRSVRDQALRMVDDKVDEIVRILDRSRQTVGKNVERPLEKARALERDLGKQVGTEAFAEKVLAVNNALGRHLGKVPEEKAQAEARQYAAGRAVLFHLTHDIPLTGPLLGEPDAMDAFVRAERAEVLSLVVAAQRDMGITPGTGVLSVALDESGPSLGKGAEIA